MNKEVVEFATGDLGHKLIDDSPLHSSVERLTCTTCGRAVLQVRHGARRPYGSALDGECPGFDISSGVGYIR